MDADLGHFCRRSTFGRLLPGLTLVCAIAVLATLLRRLPGLSMLSPLMLAMLAGTVISNLYQLPEQCRPGIVFAGKRILRLAIVLLGLQLSVTQILAIGFEGIVIVVCIVATTFIAMVWMGSLLGVDPRLVALLAAGTSVCGASAVAAMSTVNRASEEDVTYAMAGVTVLGTMLMFLLPVAGHFFGLDERAFGIWAGASIQEVAQVTAAAFQYGGDAGETGVVVKLTRVVMLAPLVMIAGLWFHQRRSASTEAAPSVVPLFVLGFIVAAALNSFFPMTAEVRSSVMSFTNFLMAIALGALGLQAHAGQLRAKGMRPLALGALGTVVIVGLSLGLVLAARCLI